MDNKNKNVHNSGPLGMLLKKGQIHKVDHTSSEDDSTEATQDKKPSASYFKTKSGIEFTENEICFVDPKECEPWVYANRQHDELSDIDELIKSIKKHKQLQPALIRKHPEPHDDIKYEVIFGRRRHLACYKLGIPFLVIQKNITNTQDAIASQHAENKFRNDVSNYSNAMLYKRLLSDGIFCSEKELAEKLNMAPSSLNDLMTFTKIPQDIISKIPNVHGLSKNFALKILELINQSHKNNEKLIELAPKIGTIISSPVRLEKMVENSLSKKEKRPKSEQYKSKDGKKLFTFKYDHRGNPSIVLHKDFVSTIEPNKICASFKLLIEEEFT